MTLLLALILTAQPVRCLVREVVTCPDAKPELVCERPNEVGIRLCHYETKAIGCYTIREVPCPEEKRP